MLRSAGIGLCALALTGCVGERAGWMHQACIEASPACIASPEDAGGLMPAPILLPGLQMVVRLENHGFDAERVKIIGLPVSERSVTGPSSSSRPPLTRLFLSMTSANATATFHPEHVTLIVGDVVLHPVASYEFGRWGPDGEPSPEGSWGFKPVSGAQTLGLSRREMSVDFGMEPPSPERGDLKLDLSEALNMPGQAPVPLLRFVPRRWRHDHV